MKLQSSFLSKTLRIIRGVQIIENYTRCPNYWELYKVSKLLRIIQGVQKIENYTRCPNYWELYKVSKKPSDLSVDLDVFFVPSIIIICITQFIIFFLCSDLQSYWGICIDSNLAISFKCQFKKYKEKCLNWIKNSESKDTVKR